jgi:photosystem II stability/assembly factor-like uncharacterized protein
MTPTELELFNWAVGLARAGQTQEAYAEFKRLAFNNPHDTNLLLWIAATSPYQEEIQSVVQRVGGKDPAPVSAPVQFLIVNKRKPLTTKQIVLRIFLGIIVIIGVWILLGPEVIINRGEPSSQPELRAISCPSATTCYAVGRAIMATTDGGKTWINQLNIYNEAFTNIACPDVNTCIAVGYVGGILSTTNGGKEWNRYSVPNNQYFSSVSCPNTTICFAEGSGSDSKGVSTGTIIMSTIDNGKTWTKLWSDTNNWFFHISCPTPLNCYVINSDEIFSTSDGGKNWSVKEPPSSLLTLGQTIKCPDVNTCFAITDNSDGILVTRDGGKTWDRAAIDSVKSLLTTPSKDAQSYQFSIKDLSCPDTSTCFAAGYETHYKISWTGEPIGTLGDGGILITSDGGKTWTAKSSKLTKRLQAINCPNSNTCFALDEANRIIGSKDGGNSWVIQYNKVN